MSGLKKFTEKIGVSSTLFFWFKYYAECCFLYIAYAVVTIIPERRKKIRKYPDTIQLPITYKCNFDCVMCGMHHLINNKDFTYKELEKILQDKLFSRVKSVGINGGEPFLKEDLLQCIQVILKELPHLKNIYIISNGYFTENMCEKLIVIKKMCDEENIKLHLSLSVDGIGDMQDFHRGHKYAWRNIQSTLHKILKEKGLYCDSFNIICTITRHNIYDINTLEYWADSLNIPVEYNIATVNSRIDNFDKLDDFSIFSDMEARMLAAEFFHGKFKQTKSQKYFAIYYFVKNRERIAKCPCQYNQWVTLTPNCQLGYCATHSKELGNAVDTSAFELFNDNIPYLKKLTTEFCKTCSHYSSRLTNEGKKRFFKEWIRIHKST